MRKITSHENSLNTCSFLQKGDFACPKKGNEAGEGSRAQVLWGAAEGTGVV